jgi:hypothetical protein
VVVTGADAAVVGDVDVLLLDEVLVLTPVVMRCLSP